MPTIVNHKERKELKEHDALISVIFVFFAVKIPTFWSLASSPPGPR